MSVMIEEDDGRRGERCGRPVGGGTDGGEYIYAMVFAHAAVASNVSEIFGEMGCFLALGWLSRPCRECKLQ